MDTQIYLHYMYFLHDYLGDLIVDLELDQKSEEEIVNALNDFEIKVKNDIIENFEDIDEDRLLLGDFFSTNVIFDGDSISIDEEFFIDIDKLATNSALLYITALKKEKTEILRCFKNLSYLKEYWTLPISQIEYCDKLNLHKSYSFIRRYS